MGDNVPRPSDEKLSRALRDAGLEELAQRAEAGEFNDFFTWRTMPKRDLMEALSAAGGNEALMDRVAAGEFDSGQDEAREWYASPEGRAMRDLMRDMS